MTTRSARSALLLVAALLPAAVPARAERLADAVADYRMGRYEDALPTFEGMARAGRPDAQFWLGTMYYQGRGKPRRFRDALHWYRRAAESGNADAQNNLGLMYRNGEAVEASRLVAYAWFALAAAQDNAVARGNLETLTIGMSADHVLQGQQLAEEFQARVDANRRRVRAAPPPAPAMSTASPPPAPATAAPGAAPAVASAVASGDEEALMVQVGLFQNPANARRIQETLRQRRMSVRSETVTIRGASYQRLRVGPYRQAAEARAAARSIDELLHLESAVVPVPRGP